MRIVTVEDVEPHGWRCEGINCDRLFQPGDYAYGVITSVFESGDMVESDYRCLTCWTEDRAVSEPA